MNSVRNVPSPQISPETLTFEGFPTVDPFLLRQYTIAQSVEPQLFTQVQLAWANFIESGQVWALLIGLFVGYWFRSMSS